MIKFEVHSQTSKSPHSLTLYFRKIMVGSAKSCHIRLRDKEVPPQAIIISNENEGCLVESLHEFQFNVNGKKIIGTKAIKTGDSISLGSTLIKVIEINPQKSHDSLNHEELYDSFSENFEEYENILSSLEKELILSDSIK